MEQHDIDLIRDARYGKTDAFAQLVRNYQHFVYRTTSGVLRNRADAEDAAQETFIKAYKSLHRLRDERTFPTWIAQIAVRTALDKVKSNKHSHTHELDVNHPAANSHHSMNVRLEVEEALHRLTEEHRVVMVLRAVHGFNYDEIAQILDIPIGTVRSRLHNARHQLRQMLTDERGESL